MRRVLVVDDSALARAVATSHLAVDGYEVLEADSGEAAIATCLREPPDVILLDVEMPGIGGHETLRRLTADQRLREVPVLFVTGRTDPADLAEGLQLGAHDYLRKPYEPLELRARVRAAVRTAELREALRERNEELERIASVDALTGLFNRRFLEQQAARTLSRLRRHGGAIALVILDVDAFKAINDGHGHAEGDAVLVAVARRLGAEVRAEDLLGRWGGEEFVVLAPDTDGAGVAMVAERLRRAVGERPFALGDGTQMRITVSAGWAAVRGATSLDALLRTADRALYEAKAAGRDAVRGSEIPAGEGLGR